MTIADKGALQLFERIFPSLIKHTDTSSFKVASICPGLIPGRFPEALVSRLYLGKVTVRHAQIEQSLTVIGVRIALLLYLHSRFEITFCLFETGTTQIP